jgi:Domain of Unknown Function (DUF1206)
MSSRIFGYAVYGLIGAFAAFWAAFTHTRNPRYATLDGVFARLMRNPVTRWLVWALWAFIGWHLFVRGSGAFK